jgi:hypothetical protein
MNVRDVVPFIQRVNALNFSPFLCLGVFLQFPKPMNNRLGLLDGGSVRRKAEYKQTSVPLVGFEPTTLVFEQVKRVHALNHAVTVISSSLLR